MLLWMVRTFTLTLESSYDYKMRQVQLTWPRNWMQKHREVLLIFLPQTQGESWVLGQDSLYDGTRGSVLEEPPGAATEQDSTLGYGCFASWRSRAAFSLRLSRRNVFAIPRRIPAFCRNVFIEAYYCVTHVSSVCQWIVLPLPGCILCEILLICLNKMSY